MRVANLSADLTANSTSFESSLARANRSLNQSRASWDSALGKAQRSFSNFDTHVKNSIGSIVDLKGQLGGIATAAAGALSVGKIIQYSDTWKEVSGRLKIATGDMDKAAIVQERLFEVSQNTSTSLTDNIDLYTRLSNSLDKNRREQYDLVQISDILAKTLKVSGTNAAGSATFIQQFGQAASSDFKAIGQEIQTFSDQNSYFMQILRENIDTGGRSIKEFAADGELSFGIIAEALLKNEEKISAAAGSIPQTVGKALVQLDNAFLRFIGQSDLASQGIGSIAGSISFLATNFNTVAGVVGTISALIAGRFVGSLAIASSAMITANAQALLFQYNLSRLSYASAIASAAFVGLAGTLRVLGGLIGVLGGPVGVAFIGTLAIMSQRTDGVTEAQNSLNQSLGVHREMVGEYISANEERRKEIERTTRANIQNLKNELTATIAIIEAMKNRGKISNFLADLGSKIGVDTSVKDVENTKVEMEKALKELEGSLVTFESIAKSGSGSSGGGTGKGGTGKTKQDVYGDIVKSLKEESEQLQVQTQLYGQKESAIGRAQTQLKIQNQLTEAGIVLTEKQKESINGYLSKIEEQTELQKQQQAQQQALEEQERDRQQALNQLGTTFESAFEKAITGGEKLGDVLDSLLQDILTIATRAAITAPIGNAVTKIFSGSGGGASGGGSFLSDLFSFLPSFDVGTNYVPKDMIAQIHKGEMIVPAYDANRVASGGNVNVIINNNSNSSVTTQSRDNGNGTELNIMIDQAVADNITRAGSRTNQALMAVQNRNLIRR